MPDLGNIAIPPIPQIPDINRIVNDALREAFSAVSFQDTVVSEAGSVADR